ncbi:MAG TPA: amidohydrolase, partial [Acidobacteriota bacterium]|nr:amidohydrolase [Acidobacteriota bacterium]
RSFRKLFWVGVVLITLVIVTSSCTEKPEPADLVLTNGNIVTMDSDQPKCEAIAIRGGRITAVGTTTEIEDYVGPTTTVMDLKGQLAVPGFIEGHAHFYGIGEKKIGLDLSSVSDWDVVVEMVRKAAEESAPDAWIIGRGWHQEKWSNVPEPNVEGFPVHDSLSQASPDNPVLLTHASGHASFANARAMKLSGVTSRTEPPAGGDILKDTKGQPTGLFRETASRLIRQALSKAREARSPEEVQAEKLRVIKLATEECLSKGVTSFHDAGSPYVFVDLLKELADKSELGVRLYVMLSESNSALKDKIAQYHLINYAEGMLTVRSIKRLIDGALGARGAWLLEPYSDMSTSTGLNTTSVESIQETAEIAITNGFQLCVHAIGDRANRETLDIYQAAFENHPEKKDLRWRIEHAQHIDPADIPRFAQLDVIASMQGIHATSDGPWVVPRLGEKRASEGAYVWRSLIDSGALVANGSDAPVEDVDPLLGYHASVTRVLRDGSLFYPDQSMTREEALRSFTINNAYAAFEEKDKGSLAPGKLADITVLSKDILTVPAEEILDTRVVYTIVGGQIAYTATGTMSQ